MVVYHISPETQRPNICRAKDRKDCLYATDGAIPPHFNSKEDAREYVNNLNDAAAKNNGTYLESSGRKKEETSNNLDNKNTENNTFNTANTDTDNKMTENTNKPVKYSFLEDFKEMEDRFNAEFDGIPTRFFNADLSYGNFRTIITTNAPEGVIGKKTTVRMYDAGKRFLKFTSQPQDNAMSLDDLNNIAMENSLDGPLEVFEENSDRWERKFKVPRLYKGYMNGKLVLVAAGNLGSKDMNTYRAYSEVTDGKRDFFVVEARTLAANSRIMRKTGNDVLSVFRPGAKMGADDGRNMMIDTWHKLEDAQLEGRSFKAQQKYIHESSSFDRAKAWMDKKYPDKLHQQMMKDSKLNKYFTKVEIDNDVSPEEFEEFEKDYEDVRSKLPTIKSGLEPAIRIRKLGNYKASGLYFPHVNTVCVDVRDSSSTVHELFHQYDIAVKNNSTLHNDFKDITKIYSNDLSKSPEASAKFDYYTTPTEIGARLFEIYAYEKLGIDNRLLNPKRQKEQFDYKPFQENPELKKKGFEFLDKLLAEQS